MSNETTGQELSGNEHLEIKSTAVKFGIIGGLAGILISLILFFANLQYESWSKWLQTIVMLATILIGIKAIADANKNKTIPFGSLFSGGMLITAIVAVMSVVYFLIYTNLIETDFIDKLLDISRQQMAERGMSEEKTDMAIEMSKKFMSPGVMSAISLTTSLVIGALISVVGAAIFKKEK